MWTSCFLVMLLLPDAVREADVETCDIPPPTVPKYVLILMYFTGPFKIGTLFLLCLCEPTHFVVPVLRELLNLLLRESKVLLENGARGNEMGSSRCSSGCSSRCSSETPPTKV